MRFLDSNVILRYFVWDEPRKAERAKHLIRRVETGHERLVTTALVVAEVVWVAQSVYRYPKPKLIELLQSLLNTPHLEFDQKELLLAAISLFELKPIDFIDAYNAVWMQARGPEQIYSYDTDFDLIPGIQRIEP